MMVVPVRVQRSTSIRHVCCVVELDLTNWPSSKQLHSSAGRLYPAETACELSRNNFHRPRSMGDNTFGSVRVSVRLSVGAVLFEPFDL